MSDNDTYFTTRAAEADRLAGTSDDPRVRAAHEQFADAYRERLTQVCATANEVAAE